MEQRKRRFKGSLGDVRFDLVALEWNALSRLTAHWAKFYKTKDVHYDPETRIPEFRVAVLSGKTGYGGKGRGIRKDVDYEFLQAEYRRVYRTIKELKDKIEEVGFEKWIQRPYLQMDIVVSPRKKLNISVPLPVCKGLAVADFVRMANSSTPYEFSAEVIQKRLGTGERTLRKALRDKRIRVWPLSEAQAFLTSAFLEISSSTDFETIRRAGEILDSLEASGYHPFMGYYLVQIANSLKSRPICEVTWGKDAIAALCGAITKGRTAIGVTPFAGLI